MWNGVEDDDYYYADDVAEYLEDDQFYDDQYFHGAEYTDEETPVYSEGEAEHSDDAAQYLEQEEFSGDEAGYFDNGAGNADVETEYLEEDGEYTDDGYLEQEEYFGDEADYLEDGEFYNGAGTDVETETSEGEEEDEEHTDDDGYLEQEVYSADEADYLEDGEFYDGAGTDVETETSEGVEEDHEEYTDDDGYLEQEEYSADEADYLEDEQFYDGETETSESEEEDEEYYTDDDGYLEENEVLEHLPVAVPLRARTLQPAHVKNGSMPKAKTTKHDFKLIPLRSTDEDYLYVSEKMQKSIMTHIYMQFTKYEIMKIERVWNPKVYSRFSRHVEHIIEETDNELNEKKLFHGSPKCHEIVKRGFDERHASQDGMYGAGVYFAKHSSKSNQYAFGLDTGCGRHDDFDCLQCTRQMMLCRVVLGNVYKCTSAQNFAHAPPGHHSVKGTTSSGNLNYPEYIVYRGEQAFPEFLITYKISK